MVTYDYDLFLAAKNDCKNATTSLSLLGDFISKLQSSPLPKIIQSSTISAIVTKCNTMKNNADSIQNTFKTIEDSTSECRAAEDEYNKYLEEYDETAEELSGVEEEIWDFSTTPVSGRVTVEQWEVMKGQIADLNARKEKLEKELKYLKDVLGIETVEEKKWYDVLGETITQFYEDEAKLTDSYKNIFTNETSGGFISNVSNYFATLAEVRKKERSTNQQTQSDIFRGVGNFFEKIGDFATQSIGSYIAMESGKLGGFSGADKAYETIGNKIKEETKAKVTQNTIDNWYYDYYQTEKGKNINDYSYIKYDDALAKAISDASESVTETGAVLLLSPIPGGVAAASALTGFYEGGKAIDKAYDNGATFDEATLYGDLMAGVYGGTAYLGSDYFSNMISKGGTFIPTQHVDDALKVTFGYKPTLNRVIAGTLVPTAIPMVGSISEWATWGSDYHDLKDLGTIWNENKTTENMIFAGATGLGLTTVNEVAGSLIQGKLLKKNLYDAYSKFGVTSEKIDNIAESINFFDEKEFKEFYNNSTGYDPNKPELYKRIAAVYDPNKYNITLNLGWKSNKNGIDGMIETAYHEANHRLGNLRWWLGEDPPTGLDETFTEIMASRISGRPPSGYSPTATKLMEKLETIIDPSGELFIKSYAYGDLNPIFDTLKPILGSKAKTFETIIDLSKNLNLATNVLDPVGQAAGEQGLAKIVDMITAMKGY